MTIILILLKWIAILFLILLTLFILLSMLALFAPIRYDVQLIYEHNLRYWFRVHWCFRIVQCKKKIDADLIKIYLLGIPIRTVSGKSESGEPFAGQQDEKKGSGDLPAGQQHEKKKHTKNKQSKGKNKRKGKKREHKKENRSWREKLCFQFRRISGIIKFASKRENKKVFRMMRNELVSLIKYIFPEKVWGKVEFGMGDPAVTGMVLGGISLFPWVYIKKLNIVPNFEEKVLTGKVRAKGRVRIYHFVRLAWRLYRNKELKRMIKEWKSINKT